jgi:hypothetical protein
MKYGLREAESLIHIYKGKCIVLSRSCPYSAHLLFNFSQSFFQQYPCRPLIQVLHQLINHRHSPLRFKPFRLLNNFFEALHRLPNQDIRHSQHDVFQLNRMLLSDLNHENGMGVGSIVQWSEHYFIVSFPCLMSVQWLWAEHACFATSKISVTSPSCASYKCEVTIHHGDTLNVNWLNVNKSRSHLFTRPGSRLHTIIEYGSKRLTWIHLFSMLVNQGPLWRCQVGTCQRDW